MSRRPILSEIENAFQPAKEIDAPTRFAGRKEAVSACFYALVTEGANLAIVGNRGIGLHSRDKLSASPPATTLFSKNWSC
jgi:hypothetical protein